MSDPNGTPTTALTPTQHLTNLRSYLEAAKTRLLDVAPKHLTPERLIRIAVAATSRSPKLLACSRESILLAVMEAAQLGLEAGSPLGHAYLVPFSNRKNQKLEAVLVVGYKGLIELARRGGQVSSCEARVVYAKDAFECEYGLKPILTHKPYWGDDRGQPKATYAIIRLVDPSAEPITDVMSVGEIEAVRRRSPSGDSGPWITDWAEMARKTVLRRALKYAPMSPAIAEAIARDEGLEEARQMELPVIDVTTGAPTAEPAAPPANGRTQEVKEKIRRRKTVSVVDPEGKPIEAQPDDPSRDQDRDTPATPAVDPAPQA